MRTRMKKLSLLLSLLALGALGLVACGGDDDDQTTVASKTETETSIDSAQVKDFKAERQAAGAKQRELAADNKSETKVTRDEPTRDELADNKSCGRFGRYRFAVVEGDVSCRVARGVMRANSVDPPPPGGPGGLPKLPGSWSCDGPDAYWVCLNEAEETAVAWCCGTTQREAMTYIPAGLRE